MTTRREIVHLPIHALISARGRLPFRFLENCPTSPGAANEASLSVCRCCSEMHAAPQHHVLSRHRPSLPGWLGLSYTRSTQGAEGPEAGTKECNNGFLHLMLGLKTQLLGPVSFPYIFSFPHISFPLLPFSFLFPSLHAARVYRIPTTGLPALNSRSQEIRAEVPVHSMDSSPSQSTMFGAQLLH